MTTSRPRHAADARDDPGRRRFVVVQSERGERGQLEERRARVEQPLDPLADRQLALLAMTLEVFGAAAFACRGLVRAQLGDELLHAIAIGLKNGIGRADVALDLLHRHQPQQSVLNPQAGHRQTACMRYISAPQRSHSILFSPPADWARLPCRGSRSSPSPEARPIESA